MAIKNNGCKKYDIGVTCESPQRLYNMQFCRYSVSFAKLQQHNIVVGMALTTCVSEKIPICKKWQNAFCLQKQPIEQGALNVIGFLVKREESEV